MSKVRVLEDVIRLYDDLHVEWAKHNAKMEALRRKVYPKEPPKGMRYNHSSSRTWIAAYYPEMEGHRLLTYSFGWSTYRNNLCDSWNAKWFSGPEGRDIWEEFHRGEPFPTEATEAMAWVEAWKLKIGYSEKNDRLAREYQRLENRSRVFSDRNHSLIRAVRRYVFQNLEAQGLLRYTSEGPERYRFRLSDDRYCYSEGDSLYMSDVCKTVEIPKGLALVSDDSYPGMEGSNKRLKYTLRERRRKDGKP